MEIQGPWALQSSPYESQHQRVDHRPTDLWLQHPDGALLVDQGLVVDANPAIERIFGYEKAALEGRSAELLVPSSRLDPNHSPSSPFTAYRRDGSTFAATNTTVASGQTADRLLVIIRDIADLAPWIAAFQTDVSGQLDDLQSRERLVAAHREAVAQNLFAAGITLKLCRSSGTTSVAVERLDRAIESLDRVMADLLSG